MAFIGKIIIWLGKVRWESLRYKLTGKRFGLLPHEWEHIEKLLLMDNYVILTRRRAHLSTYMTNAAGLLVNGKWGYWSHVLMNIEDVQVGTRDDLKLYESIGLGVTSTPFDKVFDVDSVALLKPKKAEGFTWDLVLKEAREDVEKKVPYDGNFNLLDETKMSCVEYVRHCLRQEWGYGYRFKNFERMVKKYKQITPDMYYDCGDFEIVYEIRK